MGLRRSSPTRFIRWRQPVEGFQVSFPDSQKSSQELQLQRWPYYIGSRLGQLQRDQKIDQFYAELKRTLADFETLNLLNIRSGGLAQL